MTQTKCTMPLAVRLVSREIELTCACGFTLLAGAA